MDITFQYPPELFSLLVDVIPRLCKSKKDIILFFRGAGVSQLLLNDISNKLKTSPGSINMINGRDDSFA